MSLQTITALHQLGTLPVGSTEYNILSQNILDVLGAEIDADHKATRCNTCGKPLNQNTN